MNYIYNLVILFIVFTISAIAEKRNIVCIYRAIAHKRPGYMKFRVENIDPHLCTHLVYAYFGIDKDTFELVSTEKLFDLDVSENGKGNIRNFNLLKKDNKNLITIAGVGGCNLPSSIWSYVARYADIRKIFIESSIKFIEKYGFNGIMLYWCFPRVHDDWLNDKNSFPILLKEFKIEFEKKGLILGVAVHGETRADIQYDVPKISKYADFIYLIAFDYYGSWLPDYTGISTALYSGQFAKDKYRNADSSVSFWLDKDCDPKKLILGVGLFGRTFTLKYKNNTDPGAPHIGSGRSNEVTTEQGKLSYITFCKMQSSKDNKWTLKWDDEQKVPYAYEGDQWIGYENIRSVEIKAKYVMEKKLGGIGASFIEDDDFLGICYGYDPYQLLNKMKSIVQTSPLEYIINFSILKKNTKLNHTQLMYHSSEPIELDTN